MNFMFNLFAARHRQLVLRTTATASAVFYAVNI
jgi:hypothetical protein